MIRLASSPRAVLCRERCSSAGARGRRLHPQLVGVVGQNDAFKITLSSGGKVAKTLKAGTYTLVIHDDSAIHNYELDGPAREVVDVHVGAVRRNEDLTLKLAPGAYKAYCSPHESVMFQHFTVS